MKKTRKIMIGLALLITLIGSVLYCNKSFQLFAVQLESRTEDRTIYSLWFLESLFIWLSRKVSRVDQSGKELRFRILDAILTAFVILISIAFLVLLQNWLGYRVVEVELEAQQEKYALFWLTHIMFVLRGLSNKLERVYEKELSHSNGSLGL